MEQRSLRSFQATEAPHRVDHTIHEKLLDRPDRRKVCPNLIEKLLEGVRILFWENDVARKEAVAKGIEADGGFPFRRPWSRRVASVRLVSSFLSFACHDFHLPQKL
jgi:hypothetical protein